MVVKHGMTEYVLSVRLIIISIKKVSAVKLNLNAKPSTFKLVSAKHVIKAIKFKMEFAFYPTFQGLMIRDVNLGKMEHALNAQLDGILDQTMFVNQLMITADNGPVMVNASCVIMDI